MPRKEESFTISFRVNSVVLSWLERGAARNGLSVHEFARLQLVEHIENVDAERVLQESRATRQSVDNLRADVATALEVILLNTTQATPEQIRDWVNAHLRHSGGGQ